MHLWVLGALCRPWPLLCQVYLVHLWVLSSPVILGLLWLLVALLPLCWWLCLLDLLRLWLLWDPMVLQLCWAHL